MRTTGLYAAAAAAALISAASGSASTNGGTVAVRSSSTLSLNYNWAYVQNGNDPYAQFNMTFMGVETGATAGEVIGVSLGVISPDVSTPSGTTPRYRLMQAIRAIQIQITESGGAVSGVITDLVKNFCSASDNECDSLAGWTAPRRRWQDQIDDSKPGSAFDCSVGDRAEVMSVESSKSGTKEDLTVSLKLFPDAFQGCGDSNGDADKFMFELAPNTPVNLVWAAWTGTRDTYPFRNPHDYVWTRDEPREFILTSTPVPSESPTPQPTPEPTNKPTTPSPTKKPTTPVPTKAPTTPIPSKAPTTTSPSQSPTRRPTASPLGPITCPNDFDYVACSAVNNMWSHLENNVEQRKRFIKNQCNSPRFRGRCHWCESGADTFTGCRPEKDVNGNPFAKVELCAADTDPFPGSGCEMFSQCPDATTMAACRAVNDLEIPGTNRNKRPVCVNAFSVGSHQVGKGECAWCNGLCRVVEPYEFKVGRRTICNTPGLFGQMRGCEATSGITAADIQSPFLP